MRVSGIYKIVNTQNGKYYVGSSRNILGSQGRWTTHKCRLKYNYHENDHLQNAWNKHGENEFTFLIVEELNNPSDFAIKMAEQRYLDIAQTEKDKCYNMNFDAFNRRQTPFSNRKRSCTMKGRKVSEETKRKISISHTGKKHSATHIANFVKAKTGTTWGQHSEETKKKMSLAQSGDKNARYDSIPRKWYNQQTDQTFEGTQYELATTFNLDKGGVNLVLKGHRNSLYGWKLLCE